MPKVSVLMATYNCKDTVVESIESIMNQTYKDWEFVICDDCSSDGTYDILLSYKEKYPEKFIILKNDVNSRLAYSLNRCLEVANGEYMARMDGDDISLPERFEKQVSFLDKHPEYALVDCSMIPFDNNGDRPIRYLKKAVPESMDLVVGPVFFHATIMMRKSAYDLVGGYTVSKRTMRAQDYDMWFRFFACGLRGYNLKEPLYKVLEDENAFKRRNLKSRIYETQTRLIGYKLIHVPWHKYIYAFKPILVALIPNSIINNYHKKADLKRMIEDKNNGKV